MPEEKEVRNFGYIVRSHPLSFPRIDEEIREETLKKLGEDTVSFLLSADFIAGGVLSDQEFPFVSYSFLEYIQSLELIKEKVLEHGIHSRTRHADYSFAANYSQSD